MKFNPEVYSIPDERMKPFIDPDEIWGYINSAKPTRERVREIIAKSLDKHRLNLEEVAVLVNTSEPELVEEILQGARTLKQKVYGNRIVLFAPLYIGNKCTNNCKYCGFRTSNTEAVRVTLSDEEITKEVEALEDNGQKRLILVYGEHPEYSADYIAHTVRLVYGVKKDRGEIRRVNINAAPLSVEDFLKVKKAGIGTYQIFQETYNPEAYSWYHQAGKKRDFEWRLTSLDRAQEAGLDDVGIGALMGLYDWRFEVLGLVRHTNHLEACYNVGPHTISFPRIKSASGLDITNQYFVSDDDFVKLVAILRLAVPYTGMILTAREPVHVRQKVLQFGVSQIDGGTKLELGAYIESKNEKQNLNREQFEIGDSRSLGEVVDDLVEHDYIPSFCTACYRLGRTGEHFMEFSVPGFIKRYCTPNAVLTLTEYLVDYATPEVKDKGYRLIDKTLTELDGNQNVEEIKRRMERIKAGERDLYF
ncbi:MAG: [FeFe] hydrogenase H-cluster radical SAM maturase HydG [Bacteroidales bacterium]|jgi:2-iminoacetate synthase|nr:[FeFe] hydrogenase H-cluster radical SAM maturase HydG [Bacteroidales bacterium]HOA08789.1 [FeFe] hydrogenase H-cluster radical SAM maturase HydG [Tenuifilaceae bacterium]MBP8642521.1 [FeFe] hydrogenase H-cluster radical SAM maturase HydG [Bacteroidales bacterium]HOC36088.1 [FeFe] hydrogenase H-cluster radical SAM maturase HydG [Tenuifilaceae bacterium]HOG71268.1 [FeFe] hydrogenase H-cluster radical SAM maturase HydG [Tenuifilaceae bacterium]